METLLSINKWIGIVALLIVIAFVVAVIATILQRALVMNDAWLAGIAMSIIGLLIGRATKRVK